MAIECRDVQFRYPDSDRNALDGVNFKITPGSLVCIVGYNGAGKSSLINLISRIVDPSSGQVLISMLNLHSTMLAHLL
jgi:ABC-type bacteriocin/lantibiotic exporter with double-glycine peptidase domain